MVWPLVVALILFALVGGMLVVAMNSSATPPPPTPPPVSPTVPLDPRQAVVKDYYDDIDRHDYSAAYLLTGPDHSTEGYRNFVNGYVQTENDKVTFDGVPQQVDQSTYNVPITLLATEQFPEGVRESVYKGYQTVALENGTWKITGGSLPLVARSSPTPLVLPTSTPSN